MKNYLCPMIMTCGISSVPWRAQKTFPTSLKIIILKCKAKLNEYFQLSYLSIMNGIPFYAIQQPNFYLESVAADKSSSSLV